MITKYLCEEKNDCSLIPYQRALDFANSLTDSDRDVTHIIFYLRNKSFRSDLNRAFGDIIVRDIYNGKSLNRNNTPIVIESIRSLKRSPKYFTRANLIIIAFGLDSGELFTLDKIYSVKYIIAIPWIRKLLNEWVNKCTPIYI